jgi:tRNA dimethylallyltransferase
MKKLIVITGPTASGKSALAIQIAKRLHTEIISADSRQIYKGIPIVTAVPTPEELAEVTHHLIEILPLEAYYSASMFESDALKRLRRSMWRFNALCRRFM